MAYKNVYFEKRRIAAKFKVLRGYAVGAPDWVGKPGV